MVKILATSREILCFPRQGASLDKASKESNGVNGLGDQWSGIKFPKSNMCCTVSGR